MHIIVTGGAGFIGSALCRHLVAQGHNVINIDKLTYAGNLASLRDVVGASNYQFFQLDIADSESIAELLDKIPVDAVMHLAAESHVDRSIAGPQAFIDTNIVGTFHLLETVRKWWERQPAHRRDSFRFHHVSTDEVFGDLPFDNSLFCETTSYKPSSPYSASKAASDHLVRAWHHTYGLPIVISNCSNNYGPYHFPEKLIPLIILSSFYERPLPVYGEGKNVRDWLYVDDHARALELIVTRGRVGESYNVGGYNERTNIQVVQEICDLMDERCPRKPGLSYHDLIHFVADRPGHDRRYAIDASKLTQELDWQPQQTFASGLSLTVDWFLNNEWWWQPLLDRQTVTFDKRKAS